MTCSSCESEKTVKNGRIHNGKQRYLCRACRRQFTPNATKKTISNETKGCIDKLLVEKLSLAGIARAMDVSETWLQGYVSNKYKQVEQQVAYPTATLRLKPMWTFGVLMTPSSTRIGVLAPRLVALPEPRRFIVSAKKVAKLTI